MKEQGISREDADRISREAKFIMQQVMCTNAQFLRALPPGMLASCCVSIACCDLNIDCSRCTNSHNHSIAQTLLQMRHSITQTVSITVTAKHSKTQAKTPSYKTRECRRAFCCFGTVPTVVLNGRCVVSGVFCVGAFQRVEHINCAR